MKWRIFWTIPGLLEFRGEIRKGQDRRRRAVHTADKVDTVAAPCCVKPGTWIQVQHRVGENVAQDQLLPGRVFRNVGNCKAIPQKLVKRLHSCMMVDTLEQFGFEVPKSAILGQKVDLQSFALQ